MIDILASGQLGIEELSNISIAMSAEINRFPEFTSKAVEDMQRADLEGKGVFGRLAVTKELARNITQPADRIKELAGDYASQTYDADAGIRSLITAAAAEIENNPGSSDLICSFFEVVSTITQNTRNLSASLSQLADGIAQIETLSRDLRPPLRAMREGVTMIMEASSLTDGWVKLIEDSPIDCSGARTDLLT